MGGHDKSHWFEDEVRSRGFGRREYDQSLSKREAEIERIERERREQEQ